MYRLRSCHMMKNFKPLFTDRENCFQPSKNVKFKAQGKEKIKMVWIQNLCKQTKRAIKNFKQCVQSEQENYFSTMKVSRQETKLNLHKHNITNIVQLNFIIHLNSYQECNLKLHTTSVKERKGRKKRKGKKKIDIFVQFSAPKWQ